MTNRVKWTLAVVTTLLVLLSATGLFIYQYYLVPFRAAENDLTPNSPLVLREQEDGTLHVTWLAGKNIDRYLVELVRPSREPVSADPTAPTPAEDILYYTYVEDATECVLPQFSRDEVLTLRISGEKAYHHPGSDLWRPSENRIEVTAMFTPPAISDLEWDSDPDQKTVDIRFSMGEETTCRLYTGNGIDEPAFYDTLGSGSAHITFGEGMMFPVPGHEDKQEFYFSAYSQFPGYTHYGLITERITVIREDLLGTLLMMQTIDEGNNVFTFQWNETKGQRYELQQLMKDDSWQTLYVTPRDGVRSYTTKHLPRYSDYTFRVVALGGQTMPDSEFSATPAQCSVTTGASVVYSTIWPQKDLEVYSDLTKTEVIGTVAASKAYCVLDFREGLFQIRYSDGVYGYIDSNYCLINLPDMIGNICSYNIANSYQSLYMAHGYEIPTVTGQVVVGYERVQLAQNRYLVPLLYPAAVKLEKAAFLAIEQGYKLKIYDSFRPRKASAALYAQAENLTQQPIPEKTFSGIPMTDMPVLAEGEVLTYYNLMTDYGRYSLNYFLAAGKSRHNLGVALDLTLEKTSNGTEVVMQTAMHDLTWYSETKRNNNYAYKLASIMKEAGFGGLVSEWWHFQDDEAQNSLELEYTYAGVTPEGWVKDDTGWRYRRVNGNFYTSRTVPLEGKDCTFDENGYLVEQA
ncbi:MAG: D-alanyl-D-alanine carboxypeptidase family protein [Oscillospiraceae bacterium]|nr:D-alanyl-D-alanine carboxypeptidase family protein [Oscillospiraceae bacterium]